jgi:multiple sugar transport system ATP-binding protein
MIAGLESPTAGQILINGDVVYDSEKGIDVSPDKRDVGFLFQNYALWPHMTVEQNISFGLENMKWPRDRIRAKIDELLKMLKIEQFGKRYPSELSGGQQQRVAIARTLATEPKVLFMDEPLSNLDAKLRTEMRTELKRLHSETKTTFVYVTHDQLEAMTLSTKTCLMKEGVVQQYAPPLEVYNNPANIFTADFMGNPPINFLETTAKCITGGTVALELNGKAFVFTAKNSDATLQDGQTVTLGVRPEHILIGAERGVPGKIYAALPSGMETIVKVRFGDTILTSVIFGAVDYSADSDTAFDFTGDATLFDTATGSNLAVGTIKRA